MLQIAIGRRIFDTDNVLDTSDWLLFQQLTEEAVQTQGETLADTRAVGVSNFEGKAEDTCIFVWFNCSWLAPETVKALALLATEFSQFSIAVTYGNTEFIKGA